MAERITVVTESRNLRSTQFSPDGDQIMIGKQWAEWLEGIEREFRFFRIGDPADKKDALIIYGGKEIARLEKSLPDPENREGIILNCYEKLREKLNEYFAPKKNKHNARYVFLKMRPVKDESTTAYATRLREKVRGCEFPDEDDRILEHIIQTTDNQSLIRKTINKKWSLSEMLQEVHQLEDTRLQVTDMTEKYHHGEIARVNRDRENRRGYSPSEESDFEVKRQNYEIQCMVGNCKIVEQSSPQDEDTLAITIERDADSSGEEIHVHVEYQDRIFMNLPDSMEELDLEVEGTFEPEVLYDFWLIYCGSEEVVYAGVLLAGTGEAVAAKEAEIEGSIQIIDSQTGFVFGDCERGQAFEGVLDEVEIYTNCKPEDDEDYQEALEEILDELAGGDGPD